MPEDFEVVIRAARAQDEATIKQMIREAQLDPTSLKWQNFLIAEVDGKIVSIGQLKPYPGCQELGSLVTLPDYRGRGIAGRIIAALETKADFPLHLLCLDHMAPYYRRFGYETIVWRDAPYFLKLKTAPTIPLRLFGLRVHIMRKETPTAASS